MLKACEIEKVAIFAVSQACHAFVSGGYVDDFLVDRVFPWMKEIENVARSVK